MRRLIAFSVLAALALPAAAVPLGTAFTYQGSLADNGQPATGLYDFEFCLFDSLSGGTLLGCAPTTATADLPVEGGIFTSNLDFGATPFDGQKRFLELRVRAGASSGAFEVLSPRQAITPAPESLRSASAPWAGLSGMPADFADGTDSTGVTAITAGSGLAGGTITGNGTISIADGGVGAQQINSAQVQRRVSGSCPADSSVRSIAADGTVVCELDTIGVVSVNTGAGLSGGTIGSGATGTIGIANGGVGAQQVNAAQVQLRISQPCAPGQFMNAVGQDGAPACVSPPLPPATPSVSVVGSGANGFATHVSMAVGSDGLPVISYFDDVADDLKFLKCADSACASPGAVRTLDSTGTVGEFSSVALRTDGLPVIAYLDRTNAALKLIACGTPDCADAPQPLSFHAGTLQPEGVSLALLGGNEPVFAFVSNTGLRITTCGNAACSFSVTSLLDHPNTRHPSVAIGADGAGLVAYQDVNATSLKVVKCAGIGCATPIITTVESTGNAGFRPSMAFDLAGNPVISYRVDNAIHLARCQSIDCSGVPAQIVVLDADTGASGSATSLTITASGNPFVSYFDLATASPKVARCFTSTCEGLVALAVVDGVGNAGFHSDSAVGPDGLPVVAYSSGAAFNALKVAKCGTGSCQ